MPTFGSLFAGIGGIDLGLERAGWACRWQVEWDAYCQRVLAKHWPDVPRYGDITAVDWAGVESVDLLAGGFPCQPFSLAGTRRGTEDERWLWPAFATAVRALRPRLILVENVPGLLAGRGMGAVLGGLAEFGYDTEWRIVSAADVGAPHLRRRVWIVAHANSGGPLGERQRDTRGVDQASRSEGRAGHPVAVPVADRGADVAYAEGESIGAGLRSGGAPGLGSRRLGDLGGTNHAWATEPDVGRVAHGVPSRVDRLRALGNAVVPQVVEVIGRQLLAALPVS